MDDKRRQDAYSRRHFEHDEASGLSGGLLPYLSLGIGLGFLTLGGVLVFITYFFIRDIIMKPDILAGHLDAWSRSAEESDLPAVSGETLVVNEAAAAAVSTIVDDAIVASEVNPEVPAVDGEEGALQGGALDDVFGSSRETRERTRQGPPDDEFVALLRDFAQTVQSGGAGRLLAGFIIFLFATLLVRIPIELLRIGANLTAKGGAAIVMPSKEKT